MKRIVVITLFLISTITLSLVPGECRSINDHLDTFQQSLDDRLEIFALEMTLKENTIHINGRVSEEETLKRFLEELQDEYREYQLRVEIDLLDRGYGIIQETEIVQRSNPSQDAEVVTQLLFGTPIRILKEGEGWLLVQGPDGYLGWIQGRSITYLSLDQLLSLKRHGRVQVAVESTLLHEEPYGEKREEVLHGTYLPVTKQRGDWLRVLLPDEERWILVEDVMVEREGTREEIVETALFYLETPYLWGGTTIRGADCSGFIQRVLAINGIKYPRDSDQQYNVKSPLPIEEVERGDLLFFSTYKEGASHVGLYLGDHAFIHASSSTGHVTIDSLDPSSNEYNAYLKERLLGGQRILKNREELVPWLRGE